jgi:phage gp29-like protein
MPTLYDYAGRVIKTSQLTQELAAPDLMGVRSVWYDSVANALTPEQLGTVLQKVDQNDILEYLTLAQEMEERELHYASVLSTRKNAVAGLTPMVDAASDDAIDVKIADAVREAVEADAFTAMLPGGLDALGKGYSVTEIMWDRSGKQWTVDEFKWRDPRFFQFDIETGSKIAQRDDLEPLNGKPLAPYKFIYHRPQLKMGLPIRGGLARLAVVAYMLKGYTLKDWMAFMEVFGMPLRVGRYDTSAGADQKAALLNAVASIGTDAACIIPEAMKIEFIQAQKTAGGDKLFENAGDWLDKQTSKGVLGQIASTEGTPGRLGADDIQENVRADIKVSDSTQFSATLRRDFVKPFVDLNYAERAGGPYPRFRLAIEEPEDLESLSKSLPPFIKAGLRVEESVILDKFGLPAPADDARLLQYPDGTPVLNVEEEKAEEEKQAEEEKKKAETPPPAEPPADDADLTLQREHREAIAELCRKAVKGETLTVDQRMLLVTSMRSERAQAQATTVQSLILSKERFATLDAAKKWVAANKFHAGKVDETENSYRFRQREPKDFKPNSFRTISLTDGVKAVIGKLKTATAAAEPPGTNDTIDDLVDTELDGWRKMMDPVLQPMLDWANEAKDYAEFLEGLEAAAAKMDSTMLAERLAVSNYKARGLGDGTDEP